jgi:hypothetical protein
MPFLSEGACAADAIPSLKLRPCPHCRRSGNLNGHGFLRGYGEGSFGGAVRARRIYCSNRGRRIGCGKTHSYFQAQVIPRLSLAATTLWNFLFLVLSGFSQKSAHQASLAPGTPQRIWARCTKAQGMLRHNLCQLAKPPPAVLVAPYLQVVRHLMDAFPDSPCPVSAYQSAFQIPFL